MVNTLSVQQCQVRRSWGAWSGPGVLHAPNQTKEPRGFYQWAIENKYKIGTTHPLEEAHKDAAKLIEEKFNAMVKKFVQ